MKIPFKKFRFISLALLILGCAVTLEAQDKKPSPISIGPFGSKPIQLSVDKGGIKQRKEPGFICAMNSTISNKHYSEWGETEKDARIIVMKKCSSDSGLLLCKKDNITCKEDK